MSVIEAQRDWVRRTMGDEIAETIVPKHVNDTYVWSEIDGGLGKVVSYESVWPRGASATTRVRHRVFAGRPAGPDGWKYPAWAKRPAPPRDVVEPGTIVLVSGRLRHNGCRCEVLSSRVRVAGGSPRNYVKHEFKCVDERCTWPRKYFSGERGGHRRVRLIELPVTLEMIRDERNTETRRAMIEIFGPSEYIDASGAVLRSQDDWGKLWVLPQQFDEDLVMVEMTCPSSGRVYRERVPPEMRTPLEALAWQADLPPAVYARMTVQT